MRLRLRSWVLVILLVMTELEDDAVLESTCGYHGAMDGRGSGVDDRVFHFGVESVAMGVLYVVAAAVARSEVVERL